MMPAAWRTCAIVLSFVLLFGCAPRASERPREGAQPIGGSTPVRLENALPPTLSPAGNLALTPTTVAEALASPSPAAGPPVFAAASPAASPGAAPIIGGLQPAPNAALPAGDVVIGARVTASNDLIEVLAFVDGEAIPIDVGGENVRAKTVSFVRSFVSGTHEVRIQARDVTGQLGGFRWQFSVGAPRPPAGTPVVPAVAPTIRPTAPAAPGAPVRTPTVVPTRRPAVTLEPGAPKPTAAPAR